MDVTVLMYENCSGWGVSGCLEILQIANQSYSYFNKCKTPYLNIHTASVSKKEIKTRVGLPIKADKKISEIKKTDLIIIPGTTANLEGVIKNNQSLLEWLKIQYKSGAKIITYCTGSFILAATGLLNGKNAVTHWIKENEFKQKFPEVNLLSHKVILHEDNLFIGGGGSSYQTLLLYIIEKFLGKNVALYTSKIMLIDMNKEDQSVYSFFQTQKLHNDSQILKSQNYIELNYKKKISIDHLAEFVGMSQRSFLRRFKNATGNTPLQYIQRVKIEATKKILESENKTFEEISRELGYEDISSFRKLFKKITGIAPIAYKKKYCLSM